MAGTYKPPIWNENDITAARSTDTEVELTRIHDEQQAQGITSPEAAKAKKDEEEKALEQKTKILTGVAGLSFVSSFFTIWLKASFIADFANLFPLFTAPYSVVVQRQLNKVPSLRELQNSLRLRANELSRENDELEKSNKKLEAKVARVKDAEARLQEIAKKSGRDADQLMKLVEENGQLLRKMKELQQAQIMTECLKAVLASDRSGDNVIEDNEMNMLILRLKSLPGVNASEKKIRAAFKVQHSNSIRAIITATKKIVGEEQLQVQKQSVEFRKKKKNSKRELDYVNMGDVENGQLA